MNSGYQIALACLWEASARKMGNVHRRRDFADATYIDFLASAMALSTHCPAKTVSVGETVLNWVQLISTSVGHNTNLGIILLLAPLCQLHDSEPLANGIERVLGAMTVHDADLTYQALRIAKPGGLGQTEVQDVSQKPTVNLREAMRLGAHRDLIARQYANGYQEILYFGLPKLMAAIQEYGNLEAAIIECQIQWLAHEQDSLIVRKVGSEVAEVVRQKAQVILNLGSLKTPAGRRAGVELDCYLREDGNQRNPGTTADLIAACLFIALREGMVKPSVPFGWSVEDWL